MLRKLKFYGLIDCVLITFGNFKIDGGRGYWPLGVLALETYQKSLYYKSVLWPLKKGVFPL